MAEDSGARPGPPCCTRSRRSRRSSPGASRPAGSRSSRPAVTRSAVCSTIAGSERRHLGVTPGRSSLGAAERSPAARAVGSTIRLLDAVLLAGAVWPWSPTRIRPTGSNRQRPEMSTFVAGYGIGSQPCTYQSCRRDVRAVSSCDVRRQAARARERRGHVDDGCAWRAPTSSRRTRRARRSAGTCPGCPSSWCGTSAPRGCRAGSGCSEGTTRGLTAEMPPPPPRADSRRRSPWCRAGRRRARAARAARPGRCPARSRRSGGPVRTGATASAGADRAARAARPSGPSAEDPAPLREPVPALGEQQQQVAAAGQQEVQPVGGRRWTGPRRPSTARAAAARPGPRCGTSPLARPPRAPITRTPPISSSRMPVGQRRGDREFDHVVAARLEQLGRAAGRPPGPAATPPIAWRVREHHGEQHQRDQRLHGHGQRPGQRHPPGQRAHPGLDDQQHAAWTNQIAQSTSGSRAHAAMNVAAVAHSVSRAPPLMTAPFPR